MNNIYAYFILVVLITLWSCNDPTLIGDNVVVDSTLSVEYDDGATIKVRPISSTNSMIAFPINDCLLPFTSYLTNRSDDTFGRLESQIYAQFTLAPDAVLPEDYAMDMVVDSVRLRLAYGSNYKGDTLPPIEIEVYKVTEEVDFLIDEEIGYSINQVLTTDSDPIGDLTFSPRPTSLRELYSHDSKGETTIDTIQAFESIRLSNMIGMDLLNNIDSTVLVHDTMLRNLEMTTFNIRTKGPVDPLLSFNLFSDRTRLDVHYRHDADTTVRILPMSVLFGSVNYGQVSHDYSVGSVGAHIDSYAFGDTLVTVDALAGLESEITISDITINDAVINSAYLEMFSTSYTEDPLFTPLTQLVLYVLDESGNRILTTSGGSDECTLSSNLDGRRQFFVDEAGVRQYRYRLNITEEVQDLVSDDSVDSLTFILSSFQNISSPAFLKAHGPQSTNSPMTLKISYTEF